MALEKPPIFVESHNVEYTVVQEHTVVQEYSITDINTNSNQQNTARNLQDVDIEASEVYFLSENTLEDENIEVTETNANEASYTEDTDYQLTVVQSCKEKDSEPNSSEDISRDEIVKSSVDQNTSKTSTAEDPHYRPTEDLNSEEENAENEEPLRRKRLKRRHVKEGSWKREQNKRRRELGDSYKGKKIVDEKWEYSIPKQQRVLKERCSCKISTKNQDSAKKPTLKYLFSEEDRKSEFEFLEIELERKETFCAAGYEIRIILQYLALGDREVLAQIDSAASQKLVKPGWTSGPTSKVTPIQFDMAIEKQTFLTDQVATLEASASDYPFRCQVVIVPHLRADIILGHPWLQEHRVVMDYGRGCLQVGTTERRTIHFRNTPQRRTTPDIDPDKLHLHLQDPDQQRTLRALLQEFSPVFEEGGTITTTSTTKHTIRLKNELPVQVQPYRYDPEKKRIISSQVAEMLAAGSHPPQSQRVQLLGRHRQQKGWQAAILRGLSTLKR
ncbi:hypothetical protein QE152_g26306 [Popillia japonica]|uniref:Polyprotein n=1 Tax=Popillia japonica TaxID=7064 RepID=A0AAW1JYE9_POPJA